MASKLVLFDFDGTITTKDTLLEIGKYHVGKTKFFIKMALLLPWLVSLKVGIIANWKVKQKYLRSFFGGLSNEDFTKICNDFTNDALPKLIWPKAIDTINEYQKGDVDIYIVSASISDWIKPWASQYTIKVLATELKKNDGMITGILDGKNCYGPEKVNKINANIDLDKYNEIVAYGDSSGDKEMFTLASTTHYKPFRD